MPVALEHRSPNYRRIVALLVTDGRKTKAEIVAALNIGETSARDSLRLAQKDGRAFVCDWHSPSGGQPAKVYAFGTGVTPPMPKWTAAKRVRFTVDLEAQRAVSSKKLADETLRKARAIAALQPANPFASLMIQVA